MINSIIKIYFIEEIIIGNKKEVKTKLIEKLCKSINEFMGLEKKCSLENCFSEGEKTTLYLPFNLKSMKTNDKIKFKKLVLTKLGLIASVFFGELEVKDIERILYTAG